MNISSFSVFSLHINPFLQIINWEQWRRKRKQTKSPQLQRLLSQSLSSHDPFFFLPLAIVCYRLPTYYYGELIKFSGHFAPRLLPP